MVPRLFDQEYIVPPLAVRVVVSPMHMAISPEIITTGYDNTVISTDSVSVQLLPSVTVTVYVEVLVGITVTAELLPRLLDHAYVPAPEAVRTVLLPVQMVVVPVITATGRAFTVTDDVSVSVQPLLSVTVTV